MRFESAAVVLSVQYVEPCSRFKQASICLPDRYMVPTPWSPDARSLVVTAAVVGVWRDRGIGFLNWESSGVLLVLQSQISGVK